MQIIEFIVSRPITRYSPTHSIPYNALCLDVLEDGDDIHISYFKPDPEDLLLVFGTC